MRSSSIVSDRRTLEPHPLDDLAEYAVTGQIPKPNLESQKLSNGILKTRHVGARRMRHNRICHQSGAHFSRVSLSLSTCTVTAT